MSVTNFPGGSSSASTGIPITKVTVPGLAEMKRLFVRPAFRHAGLGRALAEASLAAAAELGCARTRLDTLASMREAIGLYRSLGFVERPAPQAGSQGPLFFERESRRPRS